MTAITWLQRLDSTAIRNSRCEHATRRVYLTYTVELMISLRVTTVYGKLRLNAAPKEHRSTESPHLLCKLAIGPRQHAVTVSDFGCRREQ